MIHQYQKSTGAITKNPVVSSLSQRIKGRGEERKSERGRGRGKEEERKRKGKGGRRKIWRYRTSTIVTSFHKLSIRQMVILTLMVHLPQLNLLLAVEMPESLKK